MKITHLWRYPVKSFAGESLLSAQVERGGIPHDRQYVIIDEDSARKGKPLTARQAAVLLSYRAVVENNSVAVKAPGGATFTMDKALSSHLEGVLRRPLSIEAAPPDGEPFHDAHDILVINAASARALASEWNAPVNPLRFRPNVIIDGDDATPWAENDWVGCKFAAGQAAFEGVERDRRCVIPTIDPQSLERDPSFLKLLVERHDACFGLYCRVKTPGRIAVGDDWQIFR